MSALKPNKKTEGSMIWVIAADFVGIFLILFIGGVTVSFSFSAAVLVLLSGLLSFLVIGLSGSTKAEKTDNDYRMGGEMKTITQCPHPLQIRRN